MTPSKWDLRFMILAAEISKWSKDPSTKAGAVIVRPDRTVASLGYNGFPKQMPDTAELYLDRNAKYSRIIHCEMNALIHSREQVAGHTLYTYPFACCDRCVVHMVQAGISRFVFPEPTVEALSRWSDAFEKTKRYMDECRVAYLQIDQGALCFE